MLFCHVYVEFGECGHESCGAVEAVRLWIVLLNGVNGHPLMLCWICFCGICCRYGMWGGGGQWNCF